MDLNPGSRNPRSAPVEKTCKGRSRINHMGGGWAAAFLFFYAWSGSTEFVFNAWWGFQNNLFYTWSVFPEGTQKYLCGGASFRPIVLDRNVN